MRVYYGVFGVCDGWGGGDGGVRVGDGVGDKRRVVFVGGL